MANATARPVVPTILNTWVAGNKMIITGTVAFSAPTDIYVVGGIPFSFFGGMIKARKKPYYVQFASVNGNTYGYVVGTDASNGKLKIFTAAGTELTAIALPAGISGDTINFEAAFAPLQ